ncbi:MAG: hypothetical protein QOJ03_2206 [Frankiaceae bacterium]|jgi:hypothetical protein|nr:hypothetical protein [Frankiaceae bacterium]
MTGRRGLLVALSGCVIGGALTLIAAGRTWGHAVLPAATGARVRVTVTGHDVAAALPALGVALLVLAGAVIAVRSWLRRLVGLLLVVVGGAVIGIGATSADNVTAALRDRAFGVQHAGVSAGLSGWAVLAIAGGAFAVAAGALTAVAGAQWPALGARYESPAGASRAAPRAESDWESLDRGDDPTLTP